MSDELEKLREALRATPQRPSAAAREQAISMATAAFDDQRQGIRQPERQRHRIPQGGARRLAYWLKVFSMQIPRPTLAFAGTAVVVVAAGLVFRQALLPSPGVSPSLSKSELAAPPDVASRSLQRGLSPQPRARMESLPADGQATSPSAGDRMAALPRQLSLFRDCPMCPELAVVPGGSYLMGSRSVEAGRLDHEGPVRRVAIERSFAVGVHEVTRGEYARFVQATGHEAGSYCRARQGDSNELVEHSGASWQSPGFEQTDSHPAVCVSWEDAQAYARWLSRETGHPYRLPSEAEWEYSARAGTETPRYWGAGDPCEHANGAQPPCADGHPRTSPVGSFAANGFGLYDVLGNAQEWVQDCWREDYEGAPASGRARESGDCSLRVLRGGSWNDDPARLRAASRDRGAAGMRSATTGFRVMRGLSP